MKCASEPPRIPPEGYWSTEIKNFFTFTWMPTLVYREIRLYPRTRRVRLFVLCSRLLEAIGIILYSFAIFRTLLPQLKSMGNPFIDLYAFLISIFTSMGPSLSFMIFMHYLVLHLVQNFFAELTRFADRDFYQDFWNCQTWAGFYRKWNGV